MTIGIAAFGEGAARAVREGVRAAEVIGRGDVGGFAVLSVLDRAGHHRQVSCQRGGVRALGPCAGMEEARVAAIISSGPDRPEPLGQFLVGAGQVGLVTGHRLPNRAGPDGVPLNRAVLDRMARGVPVAEAVGAVMAAAPEADAGLIAVAAGGAVAWANSERVARRRDLGHASEIAEGRGFALLCNSLHAPPGVEVAEVVSQVIAARLMGREGRYALAPVAGGVPVTGGGADRVVLGARGEVAEVTVAEPRPATGTRPVTVIASGAPVWERGRRVGVVLSDVDARIAEGRIGLDGGAEEAMVWCRDPGGDAR
ncbi:hypothetical protein K1T73_15060 [Roseovarius sp. SCSIO 43702]|uniref:DUF6963 family protein n=1 Tax=Roseovarius sp. SCSIO 43702 TaxID=2823043 RepID=UPI001C73D470|nr:hypothetical protein [Roseovarius sp. SCSIO 43702]QYX56357.1 hypothetical protein K1T73_15060 [Roseovarius sp. SCSIO 43702]